MSYNKSYNVTSIIIITIFSICLNFKEFLSPVACPQFSYQRLINIFFLPRQLGRNIFMRADLKKNSTSFIISTPFAKNTTFITLLYLKQGVFLASAPYAPHKIFFQQGQKLTIKNFTRDIFRRGGIRPLFLYARHASVCHSKIQFDMYF